jgi:Ni,Fe-hydrogenase I cytochrome b subunit
MGECDDSNLFDAQMVEQVCIGVRLVVKCGVFVESRAQVTKARRRNPVKFVAQFSLYKKFPLIIATATAMNYQDIGTRSTLCEFNIPLGRRYDCALSTDPIKGLTNIREVCCRNQKYR